MRKLFFTGALALGLLSCADNLSSDKVSSDNDAPTERRCLSHELLMEQMASDPS